MHSYENPNELRWNLTLKAHGVIEGSFDEAAKLYDAAIVHFRSNVTPTSYRRILMLYDTSNNYIYKSLLLVNQHLNSSIAYGPGIWPEMYDCGVVQFSCLSNLLKTFDRYHKPSMTDSTFVYFSLLHRILSVSVLRRHVSEFLKRAEQVKLRVGSIRNLRSQLYTAPSRCAGTV